MGRQKEFDREKVLEKAMQTFWRYGYESTSVQDLVESMGINRGSLYDTFKDKRSLFLEVIAYYDEKLVKGAIAHLEAPEASKQSIVNYFSNLVEGTIADLECRGCLITNTAIELCPHDTETAKRIANNFERIEKAFYQALLSAKKKGEINSKHDLSALARYFTSSLQGLRVVSKIKPDPKVLREITQVTLSVLD